MDRIQVPFGNREVCTRELGDELTMRIVAQLTETVDPQKLRQLISGDQLVVSVDGLYSAHVSPHEDLERVVHSELGVIHGGFQRQRSIGTRILQVRSDSILVWGKVDGHPVGLWRLEQEESTFLAPIDRLFRSPSSLLRGVLDSRPDKHLVVTPWGNLWPVHDKALVTPFADGLSVVEKLGGDLYAYELSEEGQIYPYQLLTLTDAECPVGIVHWWGRLMLAVARGSQSWLVEINRRDRGESPVRMQIDGDLHGVWASPGGRTLAMLVHPRGEPEDVRRLQVDGGKVVYEGRFQVDPASIVWSPSENAFAIKIREGEGLDRVLYERIVGTDVSRRIRMGFHVRAFLLDDTGRVCAAIQHDGVYDQPVIAGRGGTRVPLAWNLHHTAEGAIRWTTVHADRILTWTHGR